MPTLNFRKTLPYRALAAAACSFIISLATFSLPTLAAKNPIAPYQANYLAYSKGFTLKLERQLEQQAGDQWQLSNITQVLFSQIKERSTFTLSDGKLQPLSYQYDNPLSRKKNSSLQFDPTANTVQELTSKSAPLILATASYDQLSFQMQLRLDFINQAEPFTKKSYQLVDGDDLKHYQVEVLVEETINIAAGSFKAIKLKQYRPGKDKYTLIWLAKDWQYFILRLQRFKEGSSDSNIELQNAIIDGKPISSI
ncbi:DUF3108 domain-containing protein [Dasania marina]|uniref:DUF3108 domain-containing protein n=1 Tax=Dasania marina TaxID=471499 RepID=UPI00037345D0|nr:DUF3108 domain-containing protein [Dasania marina]